MKIGILGSGDVAKALATGFLQHDHQVMLGTRTPSKLAEWAKEHPKAGIDTFSNAAKFGEFVVLSVKGLAAVEALRMAGGDNLAGKTVMDTTNPIADAPPINGVLKFFTNLDESLHERLQREFSKVHFVKAFNSVGSAFMVHPQFNATKPTMFICGNDAEAKKTVSSIAEQLGWDPYDMGMAEAARAIEPLCMLWYIPGFLRNEWQHAFKLLR